MIKINNNNDIFIKSYLDSNNPDNLYEEIERKFKNTKQISLDFKGVSLITTAFLNDSLGKSIVKHTKEELKNAITAKNIDSDDLMALKFVISNALEQKNN